MTKESKFKVELMLSVLKNSSMNNFLSTKNMMLNCSRKGLR